MLSPFHFGPGHGLGLGLGLGFRPSLCCCNLQLHTVFQVFLGELCNRALQPIQASRFMRAALLTLKTFSEQLGWSLSREERMPSTEVLDALCVGFGP